MFPFPFLHSRRRLQHLDPRRLRRLGLLPHTSELGLPTFQTKVTPMLTKVSDNQWMERKGNHRSGVAPTMCDRQTHQVYPHGLKRYVRTMNTLPLLGYNGTVVQEKWTPTIFSNNFNKYLSISIIFGRQDLQRIPNVHMLLENFDKTRYQFRLIPRQRFYTVPKTEPCIIVIKY